MSSTHRSPGIAAMLAGNLLLALAWVAMTGRFDLEGFAVGFGIGFVILAVSGRIAGRSAYVVKTGRLITFAAFYVLEIIRSNIRVAIDVVTPAQRSRPGIVAVPLDARTDAEITLLVSLVSMTPGSLAIDVSDDRRTLYVHAMFIDDPDTVRRAIKDDFERRVLELLR